MPHSHVRWALLSVVLSLTNSFFIMAVAHSEEQFTAQSILRRHRTARDPDRLYHMVEEETKHLGPELKDNIRKLYYPKLDRKNGSKALEALGEKAVPAVPYLLEVLGRGTIGIPSDIGLRLTKVTPEMLASRTALQYHPEILQQGELKAIIAMGRAARMPLVECRSDDNALIRAYADLALELIESTETVKTKAALPIGAQGVFYLLDGKVIKGRVVARSQREMTIQLEDGGEISVPFDQVERVEGKASVSPQAGPLSVRIELTTSEFEYGQQIPVRLHLTNHSTETLFPPSADLYANPLTRESTVELLIGDASGHTIERAGVGEDNSGPAFGRMDPGETRVSVHPLYPQLVGGYSDDARQYFSRRVERLGHWTYWLNDPTGGSGWVSEFLPPGRYTIQLKYRFKKQQSGIGSTGWHGEIMSNPVSFIVLEKGKQATVQPGAAVGTGLAENPLVERIHAITPSTIRIRNLDAPPTGAVMISGTTAAGDDLGKQQFMEYVKILSELPGFGDIEIQQLTSARGAAGPTLLFTLILDRPPQ